MKRRIAAPTLRRVTLRDAVALLPLWQLAHQWHVGRHGGFFAPLSDERALAVVRRELTTLLADPQQRLLVAVAPDGPALLGYAQARVRRTPDVAEVVATTRVELVQLVVAPAARRRGVGTALLDGVRAWGGERGATELVLTVWEGNRGAMRFYARHGLVSVHRVLATPLRQRLP